MSDKQPIPTNDELRQRCREEKKKLGKLGILLVGVNGAIATTIRVGVEMFNRGLHDPSDRQGMISQTGAIRIGERRNRLPIRDIIPLADFNDMVIGGWDINRMDAYDAALFAKVLHPSTVEKVKEPLAGKKCMPGYFDKSYVHNLDGENVISPKNKMDAAEQVMRSIEKFKADTGTERLVMIYVASTEAFHEREEVHETLESFEAGLKSSHPGISPAMVYAYAAFKLGVPHHNFSPSLTADAPALRELAVKNGAPYSGNDGKTGQTWMKSVIIPGFAGKELKILGWASNNWIGNKDALVLDDKESFETKRRSKSNQAKSILGYEIEQPVLISYYKIAGDQKHAMDRIDFAGFLGNQMIIDFSFFCQDSILAAPMVLDLARFLDYAKRLGLCGIQEWLSLYSKSPLAPEGQAAVHDFFHQRSKFQNSLREFLGVPLITHLGDEHWVRAKE